MSDNTTEIDGRNGDAQHTDRTAKDDDGPLHRLTGFQRDALFAIAGAPRPSGQEIKEQLERYYAVEVNHGRLYPNLDTLVEKGLAEKGQKDRRTNWYSVTERGRRELQSHVAFQERCIRGELND